MQKPGDAGTDARRAATVAGHSAQSLMRIRYRTTRSSSESAIQRRSPSISTPSGVRKRPGPSPGSPVPSTATTSPSGPITFTPVIVLLGDDQRAVRHHVLVAHPVEFVRRALELAQDLEPGRDQQHSVVAGVGQPEVAVRRELHVVRAREPAELAHPLAVLVGNEVVGPGASDVDAPARVHEHALGPADAVGELGGESGAGPVHGVDGDAVVVRIGDVGPALGVEVYVARASLLTGAELADRLQRVRVEEQHPHVADGIDLDRLPYFGPRIVVNAGNSHSAADAKRPANRRAGGDLNVGRFGGRDQQIAVGADDRSVTDPGGRFLGELRFRIEPLADGESAYSRSGS